MYIKGQGHSLTLVQCHSDSTYSNFVSLETAGPIEAKFYMEPPWDRRTKCYSNNLGHIKWPPCPYMVKILKKSSSLDPKS